jgi:hypothetical protein
MTIWAPVIAALGASLLTGWFTWGVSWWQERRRDRTATLQARVAAYHAMISRSLSFTGRASALRNIMQSRSGLKEDVEVNLRTRRPLDEIFVYDWLSPDFEAINNSWSHIQMLGTSEAVGSATQLLDACAELLGVATSPGKAHGETTSTIVRQVWTDEQQTELQTAGSRVIDEREAFIRIARKELGMQEVPLPLEGTGLTE